MKKFLILLMVFIAIAMNGQTNFHWKNENGQTKWVFLASSYLLTNGANGNDDFANTEVIVIIDSENAFVSITDNKISLMYPFSGMKDVEVEKGDIRTFFQVKEGYNMDSIMFYAKESGWVFVFTPKDIKTGRSLCVSNAKQII